MKILIVEDSATLRASMKKLVEELGHTPLFARSGVEVLQVLGSTDFDIVIMDVEMPGLDGFETTSLMREALGDRWVPIIYATSHDSDDKVLAGIEAGGDDYLVKPISKNLLNAKLTSMQRITEMHKQMARLNSELAALSQYDGLTRLLNRRAFVEKAEQCLHDVRRFSKNCAMLMMDVDFFKQYNDHYGHVQGDECLKQVAQVLKESVSRNSDLVGRYGGEEFVVLLPDTEYAGAEMVAKRILDNLDACRIPHKLSTVAEHVTLSIGIDLVGPGNRCSLDALFAAADKQLYLAKQHGRHRIHGRSQSHKTLLIADEQEAALSALTTLLQPLGNIITTDNGGECLDLAKEINPDVIVIGKQVAQFTEDDKDLQEHLASHVRTARIPLYIIDEDSTGHLVEQLIELLA